MCSYLFIIFTTFKKALIDLRFFSLLTECGQGWYGVNCSQQCSGHCRGGIPCNHVTGQCDEGCDAGWTGTLCFTGI